MSYTVDFDALDGLNSQVSGQASEMQEALSSLFESFGQLIGSPHMTGQGADSVCSYLDTVHNTVAALLGELIQLHASNTLLYKRDYQSNIDSDLHAYIRETELMSFRDRVQRQANMAEGIDDALHNALAQIRDIFSVSVRDASDVMGAHKVVTDGLTELDERILALEQRHLASDFNETTEMIRSLRSFIQERKGQSRSYMASFTPEMLASSSAFLALYNAHLAVEKSLNEKAPAIQTALDQEKERIAALQAEYEAQQAEIERRQKIAKAQKWILTGVCIVGSIAFLAATGGAGAPLVVGAVSAVSGAVMAGGSTMADQYVEHGSLLENGGSYDWGAIAKSAAIGGASGFVTGYLGAGVSQAVTSGLSSTAAGSAMLSSTNAFTRVGAGAAIGSVSQVSSGIVTRGAGTFVTSGGDVDAALHEAFNLKSIAFDAAIGGVSGGYNAAKAKPKPVELEDGPYIKDGKPNGRPSLSGEEKLKFEQDVYDAQISSSPDGLLHDPHTGEAIDWKPGEPRNGVVDFGHKTNMEYNDMFQKYKAGEISLDELKDFQFNPDHYYLETPSSNRSHLWEGK